MEALVVSGDGRLLAWLDRTLTAAGWSVRTCASEDEVAVVPDRWCCGLVVADGAPGSLDRPWVQRVRARGAWVVVVSPRRVDGEPEAALSAGADGYIQCPVGSHELVARLRAVVRRPSVGSQQRLVTGAILRLGPLTLDPVERRLLVGETLVPVPPRELDVIAMLMAVAPDVVSRDDLLRTLWSSDSANGSLDVHVRRIRSLLEAEEGWRRIETIRGVGFRMLEGPPPVAPVPSPIVRVQVPRPDRRPDLELTVDVGPIVLDRQLRVADVHGRSVPMPPREFEILEMLLAARGTVVSRDEFARSLWGSEDVRTLDVHVRRLRARLELGDGARCIQTVRGIGFRLDLDAFDGDSDDRRPAFTTPSVTGHGSFRRHREGVEP